MKALILLYIENGTTEPEQVEFDICQIPVKGDFLQRSEEERFIVDKIVYWISEDKKYKVEIHAIKDNTYNQGLSSLPHLFF